MKKVYIPTDEVLQKMQDLAGAEYLYSYILVKAVESIVMNKSLDKNLLEDETKSIREDYYIQQAICYLYPEQVAYSESMQMESNFALDLLRKQSSNIIYNIDRIRHFDPMTLYSSDVVMKVISILTKELPNEPTYRFEYKDNQLLDSIFGCELDKLRERLYCSPTYFRRELYFLNDLIKIEPAYGILLPDEAFTSLVDRGASLLSGINCYKSRYDIYQTIGNEYYNQDILTNPDDKVKKLMKHIKKQR